MAADETNVSLKISTMLYRWIQTQPVTEGMREIAETLVIAIALVIVVVYSSCRVGAPP